MAENRLGGPAGCNAAGSYSKLTDGMAFYFDQEGRFIRGSFHFLLYGYVFFLCW